MKRHRPHIPLRRAVFVGCEGQSEVGYANFLKDILNDTGLHIHIDARSLSPGAGDPRSLLLSALKEIRQRESRRVSYFRKFILIDKDRLAGREDSRSILESTASQNGLKIIWQDPCHEAVLLRHFEKCDRLRPATSDSAITELQRRWPEYKKPMNRTQLHKRLDISNVRRIASVEEGLRNLLIDLGFQF